MELRDKLGCPEFSSGLPHARQVMYYLSNLKYPLIWHYCSIESSEANGLFLSYVLILFTMIFHKKRSFLILLFVFTSQVVLRQSGGGDYWPLSAILVAVQWKVQKSKDMMLLKPCRAVDTQVNWAVVQGCTQWCLGSYLFLGIKAGSSATVY